MKVLFFLAFFVLVISLSILVSHVDARLAPKTILELYVDHDVVLVGEVTSISEDSINRTTEYTLQVEKYMKNPQPSNILTAIGQGTSQANTSVDRVFKVGDRVYLFLNNDNGLFSISLYSFNNDVIDVSISSQKSIKEQIQERLGITIASSVLDTDKFYPDYLIPSPLKLFKAHVSSDQIVCRDNLEKVIKESTGAPACVKSDSVNKLISSGWAKSSL